MNRVLLGCALLVVLPPARAQEAPAPESIAATVSRLAPEMARQVGELYFGVHAAVVRGNTGELRAGCPARRNAASLLTVLRSPEVTGFLTQANASQFGPLFRQVVILTHLSLDLEVALNIVCGAAPPPRGELLTAYAILSGAYGLNGQMAGDAGLNR